MEATPPRIDPKHGIWLRLCALALAYGIYRLVGDVNLSAGIFMGIGLLLVDYSVVTYLTTRRDERSGLLQIGQVIVGIVLVGLGLMQLLV